MKQQHNALFHQRLRTAYMYAYMYIQINIEVVETQTVLTKIGPRVLTAYQMG